MKIDFMRKVDFWIGIPICFMFTLTHKLKSFLFGNKNFKKPVKNILFIELSEMGSAILAYSSLQKIKELFPNSNIHFLIFEENQESIHILNTLPKKNVLTINNKSFIKFIFSTLLTLLTIRKSKIDTVIDLELFSRATSILSYLSRAKRKIGFYKFHNEGLYRGNFLTHKVYYNPYIHMSLNFMALICSLKSNLNESPMLKKHLDNKIIPIQIDSPKDEKDKIFEKLQNLNPNIKRSNEIIVINPNAGLLPIRAWPLENYRKLIEKLLNKKNVFIVIIGIKNASIEAKYICKLNPKRCIDLTNKTTLKELIHLFNISKIFITNDSGPAHFASLTPIKNIVFFGPETPKLYAPLGKNCIPIYSNFSCSPCINAFNHRKTSCNNNQCLKTITVKQVYDVITNFKS